MRHRPAVLTLAAGFLAGVLITALVAPDHGIEVVAGGATSGADAGGGTAGATTAGSGAEAGALQPDGGLSGTGSGPAGGSGGAGGTGTDGSDGTGPAGPGGGNGGGTAPGVGADAVTIGIGLPDIGAIAALGPGYDQGDPRQHVEAILQHYRDTGRLPVHGRDIRPVYSTYNIISPEAQRATCETFGNDASIFAVAAIHDFGLGTVCLAAEYGIPIITSDGQPEAFYAQGDPFLFTAQMSMGRMFRNFVAWAEHRGFLAGRNIGVYYPTDPDYAREVQANIIAPIEQLGHRITAEVQTAEFTTGGPTDTTAVQRFRAANVDVAILIVSAVAKTNFFLQAQTQGYRPQYLENDFGFSTTTTATKTYPREYFDGTVGFTGMRFGEGGSGIPETPESADCISVVEQRVGRDIDRNVREAEYIAANQSCDELGMMVTAMELAGPTLTRESYIAALEQIRGRRLGIHGDVSYAPGRHHGVDTWREIVWRASCACWHAEGEFQPLFVP